MALGDKWPLGATHLVAFIAQSHCLFLGSRQLFYIINQNTHLGQNMVCIFENSALTNLFNFENKIHFLISAPS